MGFFDSFTGRRQQRDIRQGFDQSENVLLAGGNAGRTAINQGRDDAMSTTRPWIEAGQRGYTRYQDALGLNGDDARRSAFETGYTNDPARAYRDQSNTQQINALLRKYNVGGHGVASGAAALGVGRLNSEMFNRDWNGYLDRLQGIGNQGQQAAQFGAGIQYGAGRDLAGLEMSLANQRAQNAINYHNSLASSRMIGWNNLLNVAATAARFVPGGGSGPMPGGTGWRPGGGPVDDNDPGGRSY